MYSSNDNDIEIIRIAAYLVRGNIVEYRVEFYKSPAGFSRTVCECVIKCSRRCKRR